MMRMRVRFGQVQPDTSRRIIRQSSSCRRFGVETMNWPDGASTRTFSSPLRLSGKGLPVRHGPPALGEHNAEVLGPLRADAEPVK